MTRRPIGRSSIRRARSLVLAAVLALATSSCGTLAYDRAWQHFDAVADASGLVGRWKGEWESEWNGHSGGLRCMLTREDEDVYLARFHSTYGWLLSYRHEILFHVVGQDEGVLRFEGSEDLGELIGGVYRYRGSVVGDRFEARFEAENGDHGTFRMRRVER